MNYYERHLGDYARDTGHLSALEHGVYTLLLDRYYATEAPIPADQAHRLARARSKEEIKAVDDVLAEFFQLEDGVWVSNRAEREIARYKRTIPAADTRKENEKERQRRVREQRAELFKVLAAHGVVMAWNVPMQQLRDEVLRVTNAACHGADNAPVTPPVTRDNTATHTPDTRIPIHKGEPTFVAKEGMGLNTHSAGACVDPPPVTPSTPAGEACKAMKAVGIADVNPSHPKLAALLAAGATAAELAAAAQGAVSRGKGFAYALGTAERQRTDAAAMVPALRQGPPPPTKTDLLRERNRQNARQWLAEAEGENHASV